MKIAALTLLRSGYRVNILTVGKEVWLIFLKVKINGTVDQLAALWRRNGRSTGTRFYIIGYSGDDFKDRFVVNIPPQDILFRGESLIAKPIQRFNALIAKPAGRIYARDIYVKDVKSPWSYNLWSFEMAPDRHGPKNEFDIHIDMGRLWATCDKVELIGAFLKLVQSPGPKELTVEYDMQMNKYGMGRAPSGKDYVDIMGENRAIWAKAWEKAFGDAVVLRAVDGLDKYVEHVGYRSQGVSYKVLDALQRVIKTNKELVEESQESLGDYVKVSDGDLATAQLTHLGLARKIVEMGYRGVAGDYLGVSGVYAAAIPPASDRVRTQGLWVPETREVLISPDQLLTVRATIRTLIHEVAHVGGGEDLSQQHTDAMPKVGTRIIEMVVNGDLDEFLKEVVW